MKKIFTLVLAIIMCLSLAACTANEPATETTASAAGIDLDLSKLSSTMVYSEVYNMVTTPQSYQGQTIKMYGNFSHGINPNTYEPYYACVIQDATACCQQGIQFYPKDVYSYPADFPEDNGEIEVVGVFDYEIDENNIQVICLRDCEIKVL